MKLANGLTPSQNEVYRITLDGFSNKNIAEILSLHEKTVKFHLTTIYKVFAVLSRADLLAKRIKELEAEVLALKSANNQFKVINTI